MDLELTEDQRMIQEAVRRYAEERVGPNAYDWDKSSARPAEVLGEVAELGLLGLNAPEVLGGSELDRITACIAIEEIARYDASLGSVLGIHNAAIVTQAAALPDGPLKERWAGDLITGAARGAWVEGIEGVGDDTLTLNGTAKYVLLAGAADLFFVRVADRVAIVDASAATRSSVDNLLGLRASDSATVTFEGLDAVSVPVSPLVDVQLATAMAAVAVGVGRGCLEEARAYALERKQFKKPIADFQAIQWKLADMAMEIDAARMLTHHAAHRIDTHQDAVQATAEARLFATEAANRAAMSAVQIHGGNGFVREFAVERFLRDAKALLARDGTVDHQRDVIAASVLR